MVVADMGAAATQVSKFMTSLGDQAGVAGGVTSGTFGMACSWMSFSPTVMFEGQPVCRHTDMMMMNNGNALCGSGGVVNAGGELPSGGAPATTLQVTVKSESGQATEAGLEVSIDNSLKATTDAQGQAFFATAPSPGSHVFECRRKGVKIGYVQRSTNEYEAGIDFAVHFNANANKAEYRESGSGNPFSFDDIRHQAPSLFNVECKDFHITVSADVEYCQGWGAHIVNLKGFVKEEGWASQIAHIFSSNVHGCGYLPNPNGEWRLMQPYQAAGNIALSKYWDGGAWQALPAAFKPDNTTFFGIGFVKQGSDYVSRDGITWPEKFPDLWTTNAAQYAAKIATWTKNVNTYWPHRRVLKRSDCQFDEMCCKYDILFDVKFVDKTSAGLTKDRIIIGANDYRSDTTCWSIEEGREQVAPHEFGHHLGNPDEYSGAYVDDQLNDDGAVAGIDTNSLMGSMQGSFAADNFVLVRHFRTVAIQLGKMFGVKFDPKKP